MMVLRSAGERASGPTRRVALTAGAAALGGAALGGVPEAILGA